MMTRGYNSPILIASRALYMNPDVLTSPTMPMAEETPQPSFHIRGIPVYGDAILAPMDGYSDWPFRSLCRELGSAMSYTEFVKVEKILSRSKQPRARLHYEESERPITFQVYGDDPHTILEAALRVQDWGPDIIDINMGCPAKSIADRGAGVGM